MVFWFLLILGIATYLIVQRSVANITRTPVWLLWLVLMTPAFILTGWTLIHGDKQSPPPSLIIAPLIICLLLYWTLFLWGNRVPSNRTQGQTTESTSANHPITEPLPVRPIEAAEETNLRNCFPWSVYYIQNIEYRPQAIICRGQLRTNPSQAYQRIRTNIEEQFSDRFLLVFQEGMDGKPFFVLVPNTKTNRQNTKSSIDDKNQVVKALVLLLLTLVTTSFIGAQIAGVEVKQLKSDLTLIFQGLPYALGLITILGIHELGHYSMARFHRIKSTLPFFIPVPIFLGTFGAFIQMRSPIPNRKALFDVSIAGPIAGFLATLPLIIWGLANSEVVPISEKTGLLNPNALNPKYSILLAILSKLALGSQLTPKSALDLHPIAVAGLLGLIVTALNLMPVGQLDGGHIVHAMFGQRTAVSIGQISRWLLLTLSLIRQEFLLWAIILFLIPLVDEPALNDVTELDNRRDLLGLMAIAVLLIIVLPLPEFLARILQIS
ncbi:site-2 protease family protein [Okeanomitos corallinicola TIOX110]|uniref:Site-2 protease family protein n=1 Tax=Okeanomitos corallinicola TIOX110 TaxID=3133117 RepID=A0ABZ2UQ16_9CYAN